MLLIPHTEVIQERLDALPLITFQPGEAVLLAGSRTDRLLFLSKGTVAIIRDAVEIARVTQTNAVFGELSALLNQPHTADVRAVETSLFRVVSAEVLAENPFVLLYVTSILARRLHAANRVLVELKSQLQSGKPSSVFGETIEKIEGLLGASGTNLALLT